MSPYKNPEDRRRATRESNERMLDRMLADEHHKRHGTLSGYSTGCRCERCTARRRAYDVGRIR